MDGREDWSGTAVAGLNSNPIRTVRGAISFNSSTHFPPSVPAGSLDMKPVMLPPGCAMFAAKPLPIGSDTPANTIGIVFVSRARAPITGVVAPKIALGCRSTSSFASGVVMAHGVRKAFADRFMIGGAVVGGIVASVIMLGMCGMRVQVI